MIYRSILNKIYFLLFFLFFITFPLHSQNAQSLLMEPVVRMVFNHDQTWSYSFGAAHRGLLLETYDAQKNTGYNTEHLELNQYTQYRISESSAISLRFRYRLNKLFNKERHNEYRIIQEYRHNKPNAWLNLWHRARFEQRFTEVLTVFRGRYRIGISQQLSREFSIGTSTEALYSVSVKLKPEPEQRFMISLGNTSFDNLDLNLGLEYRLSNYNRNPVKEYFIYTGATFYL